MSANIATHSAVFGGSVSAPVSNYGEIAATAIAAQAKAMVESRYVMALKRPRNWDQVRQDLLKECKRPSFANNKSSLYRKPIGKGVEGLGIRFVEVALRCMTNVLCESVMVYADDQREVHRVCVTDLENNNTWPIDITVSKTVERSRPGDDGAFVSKRTNSYGKEVFTVLATEDELLNKRLALISKAMRTAGLRVIPGDLQDEAEEIIRSVRLDEAAKDPDAARKQIIDAFGEMSVPAAALEAYVGHTLDTCSPAELVELRGLYGAIRDGETSWKSAVDARDDGKRKTPDPKVAGVDGDNKSTSSTMKTAAARAAARAASAKSEKQNEEKGKPPADGGLRELRDIHGRALVGDDGLPLVTSMNPQVGEILDADRGPPNLVSGVVVAVSDTSIMVRPLPHD